VIINITGGDDLKLMEVEEAAEHIRGLVDPDANIIVGSAFNPDLDGRMRVSVVATGIEKSQPSLNLPQPAPAPAFQAPGASLSGGAPAPIVRTAEALASQSAAQSVAAQSVMVEPIEVEQVLVAETEPLASPEPLVLTAADLVEIAPPVPGPSNVTPIRAPEPVAPAPAPTFAEPEPQPERGPTLFERMMNRKGGRG